MSKLIPYDLTPKLDDPPRVGPVVLAHVIAFKDARGDHRCHWFTPYFSGDLPDSFDGFSGWRPTRRLIDNLYGDGEYFGTRWSSLL